MTIISEKDKILEICLPEIVFDGWNLSDILKILEQKGFSKQQFNSLFPKGLTDLACHFSNWADRQMLSQLETENLEDMRIRDRITLAVKIRLKILAPFKPAVASSFKFFALPHRAFRLPKLVWQTADKIWWAAGDNSTDYNHYTKRTLLAGVISSTTLFWANDHSDQHTKTWSFLDDRIENVLKIGQTIGKFTKKAKS